MAQDWYYKLLGEETGPVTFAALRELASEGHLASDDEVRTSSSSWKRADQVPSLFEPDAAEEPELATDFDLDMMLAPSAPSPTRVSAKRQAQTAAVAAAAAPVEAWYYKLLGQEMGPTSPDEIMQQIKDGSLHGDDTVRLGATGAWKRLDETPRFASAVAQSQPQPEWFCRVLGQELGPMTFAELQRMARKNSLHADDDVRHGTTDPWVKADRIRGLKFPKAVKAVAAAAHDRTSTLIPFGEAARKREWYYEILGQQMGPVSFNEIARAVADGTLTMEDKARRGKAGAWSLVMDIPGVVSSEAKAAYIAAKVEASRPKPPPPAPTAAPVAATPPVAPALAEVPRPAAAPPADAPPPRPMPTSSSYGAGGAAPGYGAASGYGAMASASRPPAPPAFKPSGKASGSSFDLGGMLGDLKDKLDVKAISAIVIILVVGGYLLSSQLGFSLSFGPPAGAREYGQISVMWEEIKQIHTKGDKPVDWAAFKSEHQGEINEILANIKKQSPGSDKRLLQLMLFCSQNHLPKMMEGGEAVKTRYTAMEKDMKEAKTLAGIK